MRTFFFNRILKKRKFPKVPTTPALDPMSGSETPEEGAERLRSALAGFESDCRQQASSAEKIISGAFGKLALADYVKFQEIHADHHRGQIPLPA